MMLVPNAGRGVEPDISRKRSREPVPAGGQTAGQKGA
jgi:hypothetical protein